MYECHKKWKAVYYVGIVGEACGIDVVSLPYSVDVVISVISFPRARGVVGIDMIDSGARRFPVKVSALSAGPHIYLSGEVNTRSLSPSSLEENREASRGSLTGKSDEHICRFLCSQPACARSARSSVRSVRDLGKRRKCMSAAMRLRFVGASSRVPSSRPA